MKIYKIELMVSDFSEIGKDETVELLNDHPTLFTKVMDIQEREIGEWEDTHLLNNDETAKAEYDRLFKR